MVFLNVVGSLLSIWIFDPKWVGAIVKYYWRIRLVYFQIIKSTAHSFCFEGDSITSISIEKWKTEHFGPDHSPALTCNRSSEGPHWMDPDWLHDDLDDICIADQLILDHEILFE